MKTVNRICQILAIAFGVVSVALFFTNFVTASVNGTQESLMGAVLGFGAEKKLADGTVVSMAHSMHIFAAFWLTVIAAVFSAVSFKGKKLRYTAAGVSLFTAIYMLVITLSNPWEYLDLRAFANNNITVLHLEYTVFAVLLTVALFLFAAAAIAYLLVDDAIEAAAKKTRTIPQRVVQFFRDYKSEIKKIVWPGLREVAKNTGIVLIMCLLVGALIWIVDLGLGALLDVILK